MDERRRSGVFNAYRLLKHGDSNPINDTAKVLEETIALALECKDEKQISYHK